MICAVPRLISKESVISSLLEVANSFNRFDYLLVYISLTPVCFPGYQATTVLSRADVMYRMPSAPMPLPGNKQEMQAQVFHSQVMFCLFDGGCGHRPI